MSRLLLVISVAICMLATLVIAQASFFGYVKFGSFDESLGLEAERRGFSRSFVISDSCDDGGRHACYFAGFGDTLVAAVGNSQKAKPALVRVACEGAILSGDCRKIVMTVMAVLDPDVSEATRAAVFKDLTEAAASGQAPNHRVGMTTDYTVQGLKNGIVWFDAIPRP